MVEMLATRCAICETEGNAHELYPAHLTSDGFTPDVFSARRVPDRLHYRMVKCNACGLVRSDPVAGQDTLAELYRASSFDYEDEVPGLKLTYGRHLGRLAEYGAKKNALLEIGCGDGFLLEEALNQGYAIVYGVEPSRKAVARAKPHVHPFIVCDIMRPTLFDAEQFDVVCLFQVFDHIADPGSLLDECRRVLRPGGLLLLLNHNVGAVSARVLKQRSPIVDVEHTYLYSPDTMRRILHAHGLRVRRVGSVFNTYTVRYLIRLVPMPDFMKRAALRALRGSQVGRAQLSVPLGNMHVIAQKPEQGAM